MVDGVACGDLLCMGESESLAISFFFKHQTYEELNGGLLPCENPRTTAYFQANHVSLPDGVAR